MKIFAVMSVGLCLGIFSRAEVGVSDKEIKIGAHTLESGTFAAYGVVVRTAEAYFNKVNAEGGVCGKRNIVYVREDVGMDYQKAVAATKKLIESDKIFAMFGGQVQPHRAVYKELISKGVPDLWFADGDSEYLKKFSKTTFGHVHPFDAEGRVYGNYIAKEFKGKKACFITAKAFAEEISTTAISTLKKANASLPENEKVKIGSNELVERAAVQADPEVGRLKAEKCDVVVVSMMTPTSANIINYATSQDFKPTWIVMWWNANAKFMSLINESVRNGLVSASSFARDEAFDVPGMKDYLELIAKNNIPNTGFAMSGYFMAEGFVESLKRACKDNNDLTRDKIVKATESLGGWRCSLCLEPLAFSPTYHWAFKEPVLITTKNGHWNRL